MHRHPREFRRRRAAFFAEGLREGLRVVWTGTDGPDAARAELSELGDVEVCDVDRLLADGAVQILPASEVYDGSLDPERVLAGYAAATETALADGFRGLRVSADVTDLVRTPAQREVFTCYEFLVDRFVAGHPFSALCGYSIDLGADVVAEFAALHDDAAAEEAGFRVFACPDGALGLAGEFDVATVPVLGRVLRRLRPGTDTGTLVVDMAGVEFHDHKLLAALDDYARTHGVTLCLRSASRLTARLLALLPKPRLQLAEGSAA